MGTANSGPGNARSVGFETAQRNILDAIQVALTMAVETLNTPKYSRLFPQLVSRPTADTVCLCLAGVGRDGDRQRIEQWALKERLGKRILVTTDADPLLAYLGFLPSPSLSQPEPELGCEFVFSTASQRNAIALISGTGSFCFGSSSQGKRETCGGWGGLLGDEGGGYWIAMEGLKAITRHADGRGPATLLTQHVLDYLELKDATELIGLIYNPNTTRDQLAKIAGIVFALAAEDPISEDIVKCSGRWLAELIKTVSNKLGFASERIRPTLGLAGGNFCNQPILLESTLRALRTDGVEIEEAIRIYEPALGAFVLATPGPTSESSRIP